MKEHPLRTTVIGSYPFPGWLEFAVQNLDQFGSDDRKELQHDAVIAAIHEQVFAGLDVITDDIAIAKAANRGIACLNMEVISLH